MNERIFFMARVEGKILSVQVSNELNETLEKLADERFISISALIRLALYNYINNAKLNDIEKHSERKEK